MDDLGVAVSRPRLSHGPARLGRGPADRGAVALEFALVVPVFLLLVGFTINAGMVLWARMGLQALGHSVARTCVQTLPATDAGVTSCAVQMVNKLAPSFNVQNLCTGGVQQQVAFQANLGVVPGSTQLHLLTVALTCNVIYLPIVSSFGFLWQQALTVRTFAAMPYLLPQQQAVGAPGH